MHMLISIGIKKISSFFATYGDDSSHHKSQDSVDKQRNIFNRFIKETVFNCVEHVHSNNSKTKQKSRNKSVKVS